MESYDSDEEGGLLGGGRPTLFAFLKAFRRRPNYRDGEESTHDSDDDPDTRCLELVEAFCAGTLPLKDALARIVELNQTDADEDRQPDTPQQQLDNAIESRAKTVAQQKAPALADSLAAGRITPAAALAHIVQAMQAYAAQIVAPRAPGWVEDYAAEQLDEQLVSEAKTVAQEQAFALVVRLGAGGITRDAALADIAQAMRPYVAHTGSSPAPGWVEDYAVQQLDEQLQGKIKTVVKKQAFALAARLGTGSTTRAEALADIAQAMRPYVAHTGSSPAPGWVEDHAAQQLDIALGHTAMRDATVEAGLLVHRIVAGGIARDAALPQIAQAIRVYTPHIGSSPAPGLVENCAAQLLNVTFGYNAKIAAQMEAPLYASRIARSHTTRAEALAEIVQAMRVYTAHMMEQAPALAASPDEGDIIREDLLAEIVRAYVEQNDFPHAPGWEEKFAAEQLNRAA